MGSPALNSVRRITETTIGTTPGGGAALVIPFETFKLNGPIAREQPGNVQANRTPTDNPATDISVTGSGEADVVYADYQTIEEDVMSSVYSGVVTVTGTDIAAVVSGNKLTKTSGGWSTLAAGDFVTVQGFSTNAASFLARVTAVTSTDLSLDPAWKTLLAEAASASITVSYGGLIRPATTFRTGTYEIWNAPSSHGSVARGVACTKWDLQVPHPNKCKQSFDLVGMTYARISSQLANASTVASGNSIWNSNRNFGDTGNAAKGGGFRYGGVLQTGLRVKNLGFTLNNPAQAYGSAGTLGPVNVTLNERFTLEAKLTVFRDSAGAEDLIDDALDPDTEASFAWTMVDAAGHRKLFYLPRLQPSNQDVTGVQQNDQEMVDLTFMGKVDSVHGLMQVVLFP